MWDAIEFGNRAWSFAPCTRSSSATSCITPCNVEPDWSTIFDWDQKEAACSRRRFLGETAGTGRFVLPIHFPHPTTGRIEADGERFHYKFVR